jgi:hypothetical protein
LTFLTVVTRKSVVLLYSARGNREKFLGCGDEKLRAPSLLINQVLMELFTSDIEKLDLASQSWMTALAECIQSDDQAALND